MVFLIEWGPGAGNGKNRFYNTVMCGYFHSRTMATGALLTTYLLSSWPRGLWDLSSPTRDQTWALGGESTEHPPKARLLVFYA